MILVSAATQLRHSFGAGCGACPTSADSVSGLLPVSFLFYCAYRFYLFIRFLFILFMVLLCPCILGSPGGLCITDTRRDE